MAERVRTTKPPSGCSRWLFRLPIRIYAAGLGWLLGGRFVKISHTGRASGKTRQVVLEVVESDRPQGIFYVVAAWGERADWFQNILANPAVQYQVGRSRYRGRAEVLAREEAARVFVQYGHKHAIMLQSLMNFVGIKIERDESSYRSLADYLPVVRLVPEDSSGGR